MVYSPGSVKTIKPLHCCWDQDQSNEHRFWTQKCGRGWEIPGFYLSAFPCYDVNHYLQKLLVCHWHPLIFSPPPREMLNTILWLLLFIVSAFNHISVRHFSIVYYLSTIHERQRRCTLEVKNRIKIECNVSSVQFSVVFNEMLKKLYL